MFELSTSAGYAILALGFLECCGDRWVLAKEIAAATGITGPYLAKILHRLVGAKLIRAKRGYRGGVRLSRSSRQISVMEIAEAVDHRPRKPACLLGLADCSDEQSCPVHRVWKSARDRMEAMLARLTLAEVAEAMAERSAGPARNTERRPAREPRTRAR